MNGTPNETQVAKIVYHRVLAIMKFALNLEEFSYREKGREDPRYKHFKQQLMANVWDNLRGLFKEMSDLNLLEKYGDEDVKGGFKDSKSGGSGYINTREFQKWLDEQ